MNGIRGDGALLPCPATNLVPLLLTKAPWDQRTSCAPVGEFSSYKDSIDLSVVLDILWVGPTVLEAVMGILLHPSASLGIVVIDIVPRCLLENTSNFQSHTKKGRI